MSREWCAGMTVGEFWKLPLRARLQLAASDVLGWSYGTGSATRLPARRKGLPSRLVVSEGAAAPSKRIDCSTLTSYLLATAFPHGAWTPEVYADLQIFDGERPWSPIEAVEKAGVGSRVLRLREGMICLSQAWVDASTRDGDSVSGGHARIVEVLPRDEFRVWESTSRGGVGPRVAIVSRATLEDRFLAGVRYAALGHGHG